MIVRHVMLRKRTTLEDGFTKENCEWMFTPDSRLSREPQTFHVLFEKLALRTSADFRAAYEEAVRFGKALGKGGKGGGFMKNLMQQRICSSIVAGLNTAKALLEGRTITEETDDAALMELSLGKADTGKRN
ncbi:MAG: hypothetical protein R3E93_12335 [Thiothrix sp.]